MRKYLIFNLIEFFLWGYTSYWDMTFNYKTNLSIQDSIFIVALSYLFCGL